MRAVVQAEGSLDHFLDLDMPGPFFRRHAAPAAGRPFAVVSQDPAAGIHIFTVSGQVSIDIADRQRDGIVGEIRESLGKGRRTERDTPEGREET